MIKINAEKEVVNEIENALGNFIGQALIREINIDEILDLFDADVITKRVSGSVLEYLHYYENEKYFTLETNRKPYYPTKYSQTILGFIYFHGGNPNELLKIETNIPKATPSGEYTLYYSVAGMTLLSGATTIWQGLIPWDDYSSDKSIGFDFYFYRGDNPEPNDSVRISTNGYLTMFQKGLGALDGTDPTNDQISLVVDPDGYVAPWWDDLIIKMQGTTDEVKYKTEGAVGSRVFTVEYFSVTRDGGALDDYHYFQIKLNEATNVINFRYGDWSSDYQDDATIGIEDYFGYDGDCGFNCTNTNSTQPAMNINYQTSTPGYWTGEVSTDWLDPDNWDDHSVPDGNTDVVIQGDCPYHAQIFGPLYINSPAANTYECNSLKIQAGGRIQTTGTTASVYNRGELIVDGQLGIFADLYLADGSVTTLTGLIWTGKGITIHGEAYHYDGSVFTQIDGSYYVESIHIEEFAQFYGDGGDIRLYKSGVANTLQEIRAYNPVGYFNTLTIFDSIDARIYGDLVVNITVSNSGNTIVYGTMVSGSLTVWGGGELAINSHSSVTTTEFGANFWAGASLIMHSYTIPPDEYGADLYCKSLNFDPGTNFNAGSCAKIHIEENLRDSTGHELCDVRFIGSEDSWITGYPNFRNVIVEKEAAKVWYFSDDTISISENLTINSGNFDPLDNPIKIDSSWTNNVGDTGFDEGSGTVIFTGNKRSYLETDEIFYDIIIYDTLIASEENVITVINTIDVYGGFLLGEGISLFLGNSLNVYNGGTFRVSGFSGIGSLVSNYSGFYDLNIFSGAEIGAYNVIFEYMSTDGINVHDGAIMSNNCFKNCTFRNGIFSGTLLTLNNNQDITIKEAVFPENTWGGYSNVAKIISQGNVTFEDYSGDYGGESNENDPYNRISWIIPGFGINATVLLEGPFNGTDMNTDLNSQGLLPLSQPYSGPPWDYPGTESIGSIPNPDVVDWVLVEIRDALDEASATSSTIFAQQAAFLLNNGNIVGLDGSSIPHFDGFIIDKLYLVIHHRNHLAIMSSGYGLIEIDGIYSRDFTEFEIGVYGGLLGHKDIGDGKYGMITGDGDASGDIYYYDKEYIWEPQTGLNNYLPADFNLNGQVNNNDKIDFWWINYSSESQVPD